jgi:uroporphyrin-III C-methyltransferase
MQTADVVLYDRLVSDDILRLAHGGARMVYVGKQAGFHTRSQEQIHELLCEFASAGNKVLRLKGGDPYVFGRGGEEMLYLQQRGIKVHCIPGITAASGICADIGVPLTHRGLATSVKFLTGHSREGGQEQLDESIDSGVDAHTTLVIYMGLSTLPEVTRRLVASGLAADTPAVAVERGTLPSQRAVFAPLQDLHQAVQEHELQSPTLIVIGDVVSLAPGWQSQLTAGRSDVVPSSGQYMHLQTPAQLSAQEALGEAAFSQML